MTTIPVERELLERIAERCALVLSVADGEQLSALLSEQPQAGAGQLPVEWRCRIAGSDHYAHFPTKRCRFCEPLYTAQPPQIDEVRRLREALEKVGDRLEAFIDDEMDMPHASMEVCKGIIDAALTHPPKGEEE